MQHTEADSLNTHLFHEGTSVLAYGFLGAHPTGREGCYRFCVWAPHAKGVAVTGSFNDWGEAPMTCLGNGIWEVTLANCHTFDSYKFLVTAPDGKVHFKADPYAFHADTRPWTNSKLFPLDGYRWQDEAWMNRPADPPLFQGALNIYEVHAGSWRRQPNGDFLDYRSLAHQLAPYVKEMGFNCVELLPLTEYPFDDSWGYQCTGYFAPTSRYGTPHDFMYFVDYMHQNGIAVLLDWVPAHFCKDDHGLIDFDGTSCYEYADPKKREHSSWGTRIFDYGKPEVRSFLLSSAAFWLREYHIDGLRVDAVASMLYLDYDRADGQWTPNIHGGKENLEAISFLQELNRVAFSVRPNILMVAEESTAWPLVTRPPEAGGLGFNLKWNMGWMNDICHYLKMDPWFRQGNHRDITFSMMYAFSENYVLPLSHDEVVHMKGSVCGKMPGDHWQQLAGVRGFYSYTIAHPGKKLSFMGVELGTLEEWNAGRELDWSLLEKEEHRQLKQYIHDVNHLYQDTPALWQVDDSWDGFQWLVQDDNYNNVVVFLRRDRKGNRIVCAVNFSPNGIEDYRFGCPPVKKLTELLNSDSVAYGGSGFVNTGSCAVTRTPSHGLDCSVSVRIPPLGAVFFRTEGVLPPPRKQKTRKKTITSGKSGKPATSAK